MRVCKCGGIVGQHELTKGREAWTCRSCGRYEVFTKPLSDVEHAIDALGAGMEIGNQALANFACGIETAQGIAS